MDERELEEIRRRKMMELQKMREEEIQKEQMKQQIELQKKAILRQILEPEARERLARLKLAHPDIAEAVENQLIFLAQSGRIKNRISDDVLVAILRQIASRKREPRIIRK
ncbi:DNA-binding protein [Archaeoglobus profundus]|uniref:DNA-binding protein Arcpr_0238 n=1 Tax=Archaeoglobus profundus (strain DSM 5631 / JCM 9629 / NBRC 100127 / Av18) TaxID=572546 RepID=D2RG83_ARCPA|nr:DNA-binding protein [Archaeoglobus profundus]ADB57308.1 DNA-binding TFAR19-related protein [Archaeoglobus profundus DSM 5631]